jgi:hypothetical protein
MLDLEKGAWQKQSPPWLNLAKYFYILCTLSLMLNSKQGFSMKD